MANPKGKPKPKTGLCGFIVTLKRFVNTKDFSKNTKEK
jgi:hypothetical protein